MPELEVLNDHNVPLKETGPEWRGDLGQVRPGARPMPAVDRQTLHLKRVPGGVVLGSWSLGEPHTRVLTLRVWGAGVGPARVLVGARDGA